MAVQVFCQAAATVGEVLAMGDQPLMQMAGEQGDAVGAGVMPEWTRRQPCSREETRARSNCAVRGACPATIR